MSCLYSFSSIHLLPFSFESNKIRPSPSQFHENSSMKATSGFFLPTLRSVIYWFSASSNQVNVSFLFETFSFLGFQDKKLLIFFLPHQEFLLCNLRKSVLFVDSSSSSQTLRLRVPILSPWVVFLSLHLLPQRALLVS